MSATIGSVFLGDFARNRVLSTGTPPASPPPFGTNPSPTTMASAGPQKPSASDNPQVLPSINAPPPNVSIDPEHSLELRMRWLEAIIFGIKPEEHKSKDRESHGETLAQGAEKLQKRLNAVVQSNDGLKQFIEQYDKNAQFLTPAFALSGTVPLSAPMYQDMTPAELEAFVTELEPDIRAAERDMREIESLEAKDVLGAGNLPEYEKLQPRLNALLKSYEEDHKLAVSLESRISALIETHATRMDALSELFVEWDDTLTQAENKISKLQREKLEKQRLGME